MHYGFPVESEALNGLQDKICGILFHSIPYGGSTPKALWRCGLDARPKPW